MSDLSQEFGIDRRATILFFALLVCCASATSAQSVQSPHSTLQRYCRMDADGTQLAPGGWLKLARMSIPTRELSPGPLVVLFDKIKVIRSYSIGQPVMEGHDRATIGVRYSYEGEIDYGSLAFSGSAASTPHEAERTFRLLLTDKQYAFGQHGEEKILKGQRMWRIEGLPKEPHLTIDAAIICVKKLAQESTDPKAKENSKATLAALERLRTYTASTAKK